MFAAACEGSSGTASLGDAGTGGDGTTADVSPGGTDAAHDASPEAAPDAGDTGAQAQTPTCIGAAGEDAGTICSTASCIDDNWAQWPMPNSAAEVAGGAPNSATYTVHGDGTVTDDVTGLTWQQAPPSSPVTLADATSYCATLVLGGHADWRLPTYIELVSIVDLSQVTPSLDRTAFPSGSPADGWASTLLASDLTSAWEVYFTVGDSSQDPVDTTNNLRCVRGPDAAPLPAVPPARYAIAAGEVRDTKTGLTWKQDVSASTFAWADAKTYCTSLSDGGVAWRLPTMKELVTLVDVTRVAPPTIDCEAFPAASGTAAWSASSFLAVPSYAWAVDFHGGYAISLDPSVSLGVRCVR